MISVTRLGDLLDFSKHLGTINLPKSPTFLGNFSKGVNIFNFQVKSFWATFIDNWQLFTGHTDHDYRNPPMTRRPEADVINKFAQKLATEVFISKVEFTLVRCTLARFIIYQIFCVKVKHNNLPRKTNLFERG